MTAMECSIPKCLSPANAKGMCSSHYGRMKRHGDPLAGLSRYNTPGEALANRVRRDGQCLTWTGALNSRGYGSIWVDGAPMAAHRAAWKLAGRSLAEGHELDHTCHNRACINLAHLRPVTHINNTRSQAGGRSNNTSGHRGVIWHKHTRTWASQVFVDGKAIFKSGFDTKEEAAREAATVRSEHFGIYAGKG